MDFFSNDHDVAAGDRGAAVVLREILPDGDYTHKEVKVCCDTHGITQHFTRLTGQHRYDVNVSLADAEWDAHRMVACPVGNEPVEQP